MRKPKRSRKGYESGDLGTHQWYDARVDQELQQGLW